MCRMLAATCLVLAMVSTSYGVVIGNWENGDGDMEGWSLWSGALANPDMTYGNTLGSESLGVLIDPAGYWQLTYLPLPRLATGTYTISMDVTFNPEEWVAGTDAWAQIDDMYYKDDVTWGWHQVQLTNIIDRSTGLTVNKEWHGGADDADRTYSWTFTNTAGPIYELGFAMQEANNNNWEQVGLFYIDNVTLTPEPATMTLLGLGGLALIRRKK